MTKGKWFLLMALLLAISLGCWKAEPPAPERDFPIETLLVDISVFPEGWEVIQPPKPYPLEEMPLVDESMTIRFIYAPGDPERRLRAGHFVFRFQWTDWAAEEFQNQQRIVFSAQPKIPEKFSYQSIIADQFLFGCSENRSTDRTGCDFLGQYEEYLVLFGTDLGEGMSYDDLERILKEIDHKMFTYLKEKGK